ncbi:unnamed protein product [Pleuronectes platessa]|uniref:Uncharacterized protein n=1 Tax=Pleuronectes platessa TaxID=8262 RepID=A0A9N7YFE9_PLEPL|nr:unnamed protein product [Pleuronectes platessa]
MEALKCPKEEEEEIIHRRAVNQPVMAAATHDSTPPLNPALVLSCNCLRKQWAHCVESWQSGGGGGVRWEGEEETGEEKSWKGEMTEDEGEGIELVRSALVVKNSHDPRLLHIIERRLRFQRNRADACCRLCRSIIVLIMRLKALKITMRQLCPTAPSDPLACRGLRSAKVRLLFSRTSRNDNCIGPTPRDTCLAPLHARLPASDERVVNVFWEATDTSCHFLVLMTRLRLLMPGDGSLQTLNGLKPHDELRSFHL